MNISSILAIAGKQALKEIPLGGLVIDIAEIALGKKIDRKKVSGDELHEQLQSLPADQLATLLGKQLDTKVALVESHDALKTKMEEDSPSSRSRSIIAIMIAVVLLVFSCGFALMLAHMYIYNGIVPPIEYLLVVFGLPTLALLTFFGINTEQFQSLLVSVIARSIAKKGAK